MRAHPIYVGPGGISEPLTPIGGPEAEHVVRVRRARPGDAAELFDGAGLIARGVLAEVRKSAVSVRIESIERVEKSFPAVEVWSATPKGPRLEKMLDMLSQAGAASWRAMNTKHGVVDPGEGKRERGERIVIESLKQCGRAHVMRIEDKSDFVRALEAAPGVRLVLADASGGGYSARGSESVRLLIGPEGGWHASEVEAARGAGAGVVSFGPLVMRIETAAVVGVGVILNAERAAR